MYELSIAKMADASMSTFAGVVSERISILPCCALGSLTSETRDAFESHWQCRLLFPTIEGPKGKLF